MKRKDMLKVIRKSVKKWQDCKFEPRMYEEILSAIEKAGMVPPPDLSTSAPFGGHACQWEYDGEYHE
jgi:hypothetical protein